MDNESVVLINNNKVPEMELEKYFALKALRDNPGILENFFTFEKLVYVLNNLKPNVDVWEPPTILMCAKAVKELNILGYKVDNLEIKEYLSQIAVKEGWVNLPEILNFAQHELNNLNVRDFELDDDAKKNQELKHQAVEEYLKN